MQCLGVEILDGHFAGVIVPAGAAPRVLIPQGRRAPLLHMYDRIREDDGSYVYVSRGLAQRAA